jgi:hypothetical protein
MLLYGKPANLKLVGMVRKKPLNDREPYLGTFNQKNSLPL